jgi:YHS domain-containing protein
MDVDEREAKAKGLTAEFGGQVRFFCSEECRDRFLAEPTRHWQAQQAGADVAKYQQRHHRHG